MAGGKQFDGAISVDGSLRPCSHHNYTPDNYTSNNYTTDNYTPNAGTDTDSTRAAVR